MRERSVTRRDSAGLVHTTYFVDDGFSGGAIEQFASTDSVQVTCDGKFKIGDMCRPTKEYIENCSGGSVPYELVSNWSRGFKLIEIGPEGFPWKGAHPVELEGCEMLILDTTHIEKV